MKDLNDLIDMSLEQDQYKSDYLADQHDMNFDDDAWLNVAERLFNVSVRLNPTDSCLQDFCNKLGPPPFTYMKACPPSLRAYNLNSWLDVYNKPLFIRAYKDNARAALSSEYTPISNTEVLRLVNEMRDDLPYQLIRPYLDPDRLHLRITFADDAEGNYAFGAYVSNGEIGNVAVRVTPFIQRHSCTNSIIHLKGGFERKHYRVSPGFLRGMIKEGLGNAFRSAPEMLEKAVEAELRTIPDFSKVVKEIAKVHNFTEPITADILVGTERQETLMGLVNGLSWAAHQTDDIEQTIQLETLAGEYLMGGL